MVVILDAERAGLLTRQLTDRCPDVMVAVVVILPGGKTLAERHNARMGRTLLVRELCLMAVQGKREDVTEIPKEWVERQPEPTVAAPALTGAALRIYSLTGTPSDPNYQFVGVIGLLGLESLQAVNLLCEAVAHHGFLTTRDLPHGGVQA